MIPVGYAANGHLSTLFQDPQLEPPWPGQVRGEAQREASIVHSSSAAPPSQSERLPIPA